MHDFSLSIFTHPSSPDCVWTSFAVWEFVHVHHWQRKSCSELRCSVVSKQRFNPNTWLIVQDANAPKILFVEFIKSAQWRQKVKAPIPSFQFICTKTVRRLDPLPVCAVNNKGQDPSVTTPWSWMCLRINAQNVEGHIRTSANAKCSAVLQRKGGYEQQKRGLSQDLSCSCLALSRGTCCKWQVGEKIAECKRSALFSLGIKHFIEN